MNSPGTSPQNLNHTIQSTIRFGIRIRSGRDDRAPEGHDDGPPGVGDGSGLLARDRIGWGREPAGAYRIGNGDPPTRTGGWKSWSPSRPAAGSDCCLPSGPAPSWSPVTRYSAVVALRRSRPGSRRGLPAADRRADPLLRRRSIPGDDCPFRGVSGIYGDPGARGRGTNVEHGGQFRGI